MSRKKMSEQNDFNKRFAYIIEYIEKYETLSRNQIAKSIGISGAALSDLISGKSQSAKETTLKALEVEYGVNPEWLREQKGEPLHMADNFLKLNPFLPEEMVEIKHMKEILSEKNEKIRILTDQVEGLKADKLRLLEQVDKLEREIATLEDDKTTA